jgi:hypothetical protein
MLSVTYAEHHLQAVYAECRYIECRYAKRRGAMQNTIDHSDSTRYNKRLADMTRSGF